MVHRVSIILLLVGPWFLLCWGPFSRSNYQFFQAKCVHVFDGDTVEVETVEGKRFRVRLLFIDAPESDQKSTEGHLIGGWSTQFLVQKIQHKNIEVEVVGKDRYGRLLGIVYFESENINYQMVSEGFALLYPRAKFFSPRQKNAFLRAFHAARFKRLGLWKTRGFSSPMFHRRKRYLVPPGQKF